MKVILLGTGTPNAEPDRSGPSVAITHRGESWVVDCGPGVVRRASAAARAGNPELEPRNLRKLLLTHLHSDHTAGLADIMLTPWVLGRNAPLRITGPEGTASMASLLTEAYSADIRERLEGLEPANHEGCKTEVEEISGEGTLSTGEVRISCFRTNHGGLPSWGYRFESEEGAVVVSGDTAPFQGMTKAYEGCQVLVHEVYSSTGFMNREEEWKRYHSSVHTSADELARIASQVRPKLLVLYHQLLHGVDEETLMKEIKRTYSGEVVYGKDLQTFSAREIR
ncbi:MAG TPA: MBL fold metallo-hydrolase [Candidatus Sabulitectum sp.]|nr:MBL fold metallo-hydrolase [Candidatus Sabulitectum sp.]HPF31687.1 MBL fold metallo-hydrolase [Candidatus Sabulitectum sp.]